MNETKETKAYAIKLVAMDTIYKLDELSKLMDETGSLGVHPNFPFAYVLYKTHKERMKGFKAFRKVFRYCKVVKTVAYIRKEKHDD